jgi:hypothetical protein
MLPERMQFMRFSQCDHDWPPSLEANSFGGAGQLLHPGARREPANSLLQVCAGRLLLRWRVSRTHVVIRFVVPPVLRPVILTEPRLRLAQGRFSSVRQ